MARRIDAAPAIENLSQLLTMMGSEPIYAELPRALQNGKPVRRRIRHEVEAFSLFDGSPVTQISLAYPISAEPGLRAFWRRYEADVPRPVPPGAISVIDRYTLGIHPVAGAVTYDIVYEATDPVVAGVGLAAPRDLIAFLRREQGDNRRGRNPLIDAEGQPFIKRAYTFGLSQSGRYLRTFLWQGFNEDAAGHPVFDGMLIVLAGGRRGYMNQLFAMPGLIPNEMAGHRDRQQFPFAYPVLHDPLSGTTDGLLKRCQASGTCPKIIQIDSENEVAAGWGWMLTTRPDGHPITRQPDNVRLYAIAGADHSGGSRPMAICRGKAPAPIGWTPFARAALINLDDWVRAGISPPPTRYPSLLDGTLLRLGEARDAWPHIPGYPFVAVRNTPEFWVAGEPLPRSAGRYPVLALASDADGNALGGIHSPLRAVPVGTLSGISVRRAGYGEEDICPLVGEYIPLPSTASERERSGDSRRSIEERYPGGEDQIARLHRKVVQDLVKERYVLERDTGNFGF
ncbi:MAG TPA: alpha/beta hydrolase domain-containing protein [Rhizorhapis sp.]|nr:alpha/beta hydrolase domain-containing protein [Rhizorhapis sp.]